MKELKAYLNESKGAAIKDRTPDRFNGDRLASKRPGSMREIASNISFNSLNTAVRDAYKFPDDVWLDDDWDIHIKFSSIETFIGEYILKKFDYRNNKLNSSQRNALKHLGIAAFAPKGPVLKYEVFIPKISKILVKESNKWAELFNDYQGALVIDDIIILINEDVKNTVNNAPTSSNVKKLENDYKNIINTFLEIITKEIDRIF